jgi:hypothetical protein
MHFRRNVAANTANFRVVPYRRNVAANTAHTWWASLSCSTVNLSEHITMSARDPVYPDDVLQPSPAHHAMDSTCHKPHTCL